MEGLKKAFWLFLFIVYLATSSQGRTFKRSAAAKKAIFDAILEKHISDLEAGNSLLGQQVGILKYFLVDDIWQIFISS